MNSDQQNTADLLVIFISILIIGAGLFTRIETIEAKESSTSKQTTVMNETEPSRVVLQLAWWKQFQFAGYYAALDKGFYRENGFKVEIVEGSPSRKPVQEVLSGRAAYGVARAELLLHRLKAKPVVALATIFQHSALILVAKKKSGIDTPHDMIGKRVMLLEGDDSAEYIAMFQNEGISMEHINIIPSNFDINDLITDKTDVYNSYMTNEPYYLEQRGIPISIINPKSYGIDFYGDTLFTSETEIKEHPDQVKAFRAASLKGWQYAMDHPEEIIDAMLTKYGVEKSRDHLHFEADAIRKLMLPDLIEIGHMNPGRWHYMADTYVKLGMAPKDYDLKHFIYNPNPHPDYSWVTRLFWILGSVCLLISIALFALLFHSKKLRAEIHHRVRIQNALQESEGRLKSFYNATFEGLAIIGQNRIMDANHQLAAMMGYQRSELIGKTATDLIAEEDREYVRSSFRSGANQPIEHKALHKNGAVIEVEALSQQIQFHGRPAIVTAIHDLTQRKKSEKEREMLIENLQHALLEVKTLRGFLPICIYCKKIRDDKGYWNQIEAYIQDHSDAEFSHSLCPECAEKLFPDEKLYE